FSRDWSSDVCSSDLPVASDLEIPGPGGDEALEWIPIRPGSDTAVMLALACETILANRHDEEFLHSHCVGFGRWRDYLLGRRDGVIKDARWAAAISGVSATRLCTLAIEMAERRSLVNLSWSMQRADHGEQPYWAAVG